MTYERVCSFLSTEDYPRCSAESQRFRTVSHQAFLNRGTVRRGGERGIILEFVKFAYELKNMLLHIFSFGSEGIAEAAGDKSIGAQEPRPDGSRI